MAPIWSPSLMVRTLAFHVRDTGFESRGDHLCLLSLKARTLASQDRDVGFKSHRRYCGYSIKVSTSDCGSENSGSIPDGHPTGRSHSGNCSGL